MITRIRAALYATGHPYLISFMALLGLFIQTQMNFGRNETSLGLTLNLADFTLPVLGLIILISLIRRQSIWPSWRAPYTDLLLVALTLYFIFSAFMAYFLFGHISTWALVNRLFGWVVLLAYFYAGAWITTNRGPLPALTFIFALASIASISAFLEMTGIFLYDIHFLPNLMPEYPVDGLMRNRNAFAFIMTAMLGAVGLYNRDHPTRLSKFLFITMLILTPSFIILNGSRVIIILIPLTLIILAFLYGRGCWRQFLFPLGIGIVIIAAITAITGVSLREHQTERISISTLTNPALQKLHYSDSVRSTVNHHALDLFAAHPIIGIGLGNSLERQKQDFGQMLDLIDSVPLWFLTEMGALGFTLFLGVGAYLGVGIARTARGTSGNPATTLPRMALAVIAVFCVMGLVHQLFYARFLWLILGFAAAQGQSRT